MITWTNTSSVRVFDSHLSSLYHSSVKAVFRQFLKTCVCLYFFYCITFPKEMLYFFQVYLYFLTNYNLRRGHF